jgi:hypothetical protein
VQQELIAEINTTVIWPVVVTAGGNFSKHNKTDFIDRGGVYIILVRNGNIVRFHAEMLGLYLDRNKNLQMFGFIKLGLLWQ